jgi:hypothetical protein
MKRLTITLLIAAMLTAAPAATAKPGKSQGCSYQAGHTKVTAEYIKAPAGFGCNKGEDPVKWPNLNRLHR